MSFLEEIDRLREEFDGDVRLPYSRDPEETRRYESSLDPFNKAYAPERRPAVALQCASTEDVVRAVRIANEQGMTALVRAGVHGACNHCLRPGDPERGAILIDLSSMTRILDLDFTRRTAVVQPCASFRELERKTFIEHGFLEDNVEYGLLPVAGDCAGVSPGGFTLGGGYGILSRRFGLGCDNLLSAEVVTFQDGEVRVLQVGPDEHPDLFWAIRGGGSGFGVVSSMKIRLHPVPKTAWCGAIGWSFDQAEEVTRFFRDLFLDPQTPDELGLDMIYATDPYPHGERMVVIYGLYAGHESEGAIWGERLQSVGEPAFCDFKPGSYTDLMEALGQEVVHGLRAEWKGGFFLPDGPSDEAIRILCESCRKAPSGYSFVRFDLTGGGAIRRVGATETAHRHREETHYANCIALWEDPADDEENIAWIHALKRDLQPHCNESVYQNYRDDALEDWPRIYFGENYARLQEIKQKYDPADVFRELQSVRLPGDET